MTRNWVIAGFIAVAASLLVLPVVAAQAPDLPDGDGRDAVVDMCSNCHGLAKSVEKRHTEAEWQAIVADMREKGAPGSDDDAKAVVAYLTRFFGSP